MNVLDFLRSDGSIVVNKKLAHKIGLDEAVVYSELASLFMYWTDQKRLTDGDWFFCTYENLENNTSLSARKLQRTTNRLVKLNLIEKKRKGLPAKTYYKLTNEIYSFFNLKIVDDKDEEDSPNNDYKDDEKDQNYEEETPKNDDKPRHDQIEQNVQSRQDNLSTQDKTNCPTNNTIINNTNLNNTKLNPYQYLSNQIYQSKLPMNLKKSIEVKVKDLTEYESFNFQSIEYFYNVYNEYVQPNCDRNNPNYLNDIEFSYTIEKMIDHMLKDKPFIKNMEALIKSWVLNAISFKSDRVLNSLEDSEHSRPVEPIYDFSKRKFSTGDDRYDV